MSFFKNLFGNKHADNNATVLCAPLAGEAVAISEVNDPTFSEEILGKGVAIKPTGNQIVAPCDGTVEMMFDTGHAVSMTSTQGAEILIHVGLETVSLKGKHYQVHAGNGDKVTKGQLLITFDREAIAAEGFDTITPIVICNSDQFSNITVHTGTVNPGDDLITLTK